MNDHELYSTVVVRQATTPIRLGDELLGGKICAASVGNLVEANIALEAECERLRQFQIAYNDWQAKTDWVQESAKPNELGRHRADVLRARIEALAAELAAIKRQGDVVEVAQVVSYLSACADGYDPDAPHPGPPEQLMTVAQHNRILAASVPAGCKAVPVDLIERTICRLTHGHEHDKAVRELRALLVSAEGGEV